MPSRLKRQEAGILMRCSDLVVPSPHASRHHFEIYCVALEDGPDDENQQTPLVFLHCLNSSNGVLVNGKRLRKARGIQAACLLCHRDIIEVVPGLTFRYEEVFRSATTSADCRMHSQQRRELQAGQALYMYDTNILMREVVLEGGIHCLGPLHWQRRERASLSWRKLPNV